MQLGRTMKKILVSFLFCIATIYSRSETLIVTLNDIPYSTNVSIEKVQDLTFGEVLVASTGSISVTYAGDVHTGGSAISTNTLEKHPAKFQITLTPMPEIAIPDSLKGRSKKVNVIVSCDQKLYHFVDNSVISYDFQTLSGVNREHTIVGDNDVYTISVGGQNKTYDDAFYTFEILSEAK